MKARGYLAICVKNFAVPRQLRRDSLQGLVCDVLQAFVDQPPGGVSGLMHLRNLMVKPL